MNEWIGAVHTKDDNCNEEVLIVLKKEMLQYCYNNNDTEEQSLLERFSPADKLPKHWQIHNVK